jgi:hypothetical protein
MMRMNSALESRLKALEDERSILDTLHRYGHALDYGLEAEFVDCFTEDALWDVRPTRDSVRAELERNGRLPAHHQGRAALRQFAEAHTRPPERWHKHFVMDARIKVQGDEATAISYFMRVDGDRVGSGAYIRTFGRYRDQLVRGSDDRWRFRERIAETDAFVELT